jgi:hypothetical protein
MQTNNQQLEKIASDILNNIQEKPNISNRDFMNALIIFQNALMDKMYDTQDYDKMNIDERYKMAESCGLSLHKLIHTYTGLDTHKLEDFL